MKPYFDDAAVTIYLGDCREVLPTLGPVDLVLTDPPYGVGLRYASHEDAESGYWEWLGPIVTDLLQRAPLTLITPGIRNLWLYPAPTWVLCWVKPGSTRRSDLGGFNEWEPVLVYGKRRIYNDFRYLPDCNNHSSESGDHPCPKPIGLMRWLIERASDDAQTILDPFMGSGTTLRAAKDLGRKAIGIEIEERYCFIAAQRMQQSVMNLDNGMVKSKGDKVGNGQRTLLGEGSEV